MSLPALSGKEMVAWVERTSSGWRDLLAAHPEALDLPCDIRETQTVAQLLQHIVAVELRFAERLSGLAETPYEAIPTGPVADIYATHLGDGDPHTHPADLARTQRARGGRTGPPRRGARSSRASWPP